jgi:ACS family hexuronate transporter-like MFS transporter
MFVAISIVGIIWAIVWYFLFRDRPEESRFVNKAEEELIAKSRPTKFEIETSNVDWRFILTHPALIANNIAYFAFGYMLFFATLWLPGYFLCQHGLNLKSVGWYLTIPWLVASLFLKIGGFLSDWLYKRTSSMRLSRSHIIWSSQLLAAIFFLFMGFTDSLWTAIVFLSLGLGFGFMPQPAFFSTNIDVAKHRAGSSQGVTSSCLSLAGILAPVITGWLVDTTGNFKAAFILLAALTGLAVVVVILFHHPEGKKVQRAR